MKIELDENVINQVAQEKIVNAIGYAISGHDIQKTISSVIGSHITSEMWGDAISSAMEQVDMESISSALAREIAKNAVAVSVRLIRESFATMIVRLREGGYMTSDERNSKTQRVLAEMKRGE